MAFCVLFSHQWFSLWISYIDVIFAQSLSSFRIMNIDNSFFYKVVFLGTFSHYLEFSMDIHMKSKQMFLKSNPSPRKERRSSSFW